MAPVAAVAQAAMDSGVARVSVDLLAYEERLARTAIEIAKL